MDPTQPMVTTWTAQTGDLSPEWTVQEILAQSGHTYDDDTVAYLAAAYRQAIQGALTSGVTLYGDVFTAPASLDRDEAHAIIRKAIDAANLADVDLAVRQPAIEPLVRPAVASTSSTGHAYYEKGKGWLAEAELADRREMLDYRDRCAALARTYLAAASAAAIYEPGA